MSGGRIRPGENRGRVPFALLGVVLLVSSAALAPTLRPRTPPSEPPTGVAVDRGTAEVRTALRDGVRSAGQAAAAEPVLAPANTSAGQAIDESTPFVDAFRIRIYLRVRERLERIDRRRDDVRVTASLPPVSNASALRAAKRRVRVERVGSNASAVRVRVSNVTLTASRNGRTVTTRELSPSVEVATPVLAMHDRVSAYEERLDAGVTDTGLDRRLTAALYPVAWTRGYAQYGGLPVDNVVSNRHVAVATNAALLSLQRSTFGHSDPGGRRTLALAAAKTAAGDALAASDAGSKPVQSALESPTKPAPEDIAGLSPAAGPRPEDTRVVGVNRTADDAFRDVVGDGRVDAAVRAAYTADARLVPVVRSRRGGRPAVPGRPGANWTLADEDRIVETETDGATVSPPSAPAGWHRLWSVGRRVTVDRTRIRTWKRGNATRRTQTNATERVAVGVAVVGRHGRGDPAPAGPITDAHERGGGPLDGPNLADVRERAVDRLVTDRGGRDAVLARAATGRIDADPVRVTGDRPAELSPWVYRDLMALRERVRAEQVSVERAAVGTFEANPPESLAERLRERRATLLSAPDRYDGAAARARVAARAVYLDRVIERLDARAENRSRRAERVGSLLEERGAGSLGDLRESVRASARPAPPPSSTLGGPSGPIELRVDSAPSYVTLGRIDSERVPAVENATRPLAARNRNVFAVPYDDAADTVVGEVIGRSDRVRLGTAAATLRAANATLGERANATGNRRRNALREAVASANGHVIDRLAATLSEEGVGGSEADRRAVVRRGLGQWNTTATRARALSDGSAVPAIADAAAEHTGANETRRDWLRLRIDETRRDALRESAARPKSEIVGESRNVTRAIASDLGREVGAVAANRTAASAYERAVNETFDSLPSGLPLAPVPGHWYATTNVWQVTVRGEYARFGVRATRGRPTAPGGELAYARDGDPVTVDVDGDGEEERLGRASRVDFDVSTTVVVVVPPGRSGVGDVDGNADERSAGWSGGE